MFQSPDEPEHFDYAFQIATRGRLILAREGPPRYSPAVTALESMLHTRSIAFHPSRGADPLYGTPPYLQALAQIAASDERVAAPHPGVPLLVSTYPFGFYALAGAAIAPFGSAPVDAFFAARALCIALVCCGWVFLYLLALELGFGRRRAMLLLFVCAGLPLSAFVAGYVQPDDLTFTLVMATLYAAARLRRHPVEVASYVAFALGVAATVAVKQHVALAIALAALPLVWVRLATVIGDRRRVAAAIVAMLVPTVLMVAATTYVSSGGIAPSYYKHNFLTRDLANAPAGVISALSEYFNYPTGITSTSYWGVYGWLDAPMNLEPPLVAAIVHVGLRVGTWLVLLAVMTLVVRNVLRLIRVARQRGAASAVRVGSGDLLINAYLVFSLIMIVLFALSGNVFGAQGRNWFPFVGAAIATAFVYAPKVLPRGVPRRIASGSVVAFLLVYIGFGGWSAVRTVEDRYYTPVAAGLEAMTPDRYEQRPFSGAGSIDRVEVGPSGRGYQFRVSGWIVDAQRVPPSAVLVSYGSHFLDFASMRVDRRDIPARFQNPQYPAIGFSGSASVPSNFWHGTAPIHLDIVTPDGLYAEAYPWRAPENGAR